MHYRVIFASMVLLLTLSGCSMWQSASNDESNIDADSEKAYEVIGDFDFDVVRVLNIRGSVHLDEPPTRPALITVTLFEQSHPEQIVAKYKLQTERAEPDIDYKLAYYTKSIATNQPYQIAVEVKLDSRHVYSAKSEQLVYLGQSNLTGINVTLP